ncbi:hypothetical protein JQ621_34820 [Bradyrhizobium manausense]|uniref:hypothetical protein n=1 Tax=Bradyrhizobium manausense TaxID=989370 RepID=UPI001BACF65E|nr:hypothetical protein [Bradyrhizobium manausense]MBR1092647.1 hypothetical protein [Bradyrhizobium manausense]
MLKLGNLKGRGRVEVQGRIVGEIDYEIEVWQNGASGRASGAATGDPHAIAVAFNTGISILHLQDGSAVRFIVTHIGPRGALIDIDGPVPAF